MRIWKLTYMTADSGTQVSWHPSERVAQKARREALGGEASAPGFDEPIKNSDAEINGVDIPTDKVGLIDWLNRNFNTDNG